MLINVINFVPNRSDSKISAMSSTHFSITD